MPTYIWKCKTCGKQMETDHLPNGSEFRHMTEEGPLQVCGTVVRDYKAEAVGLSLENLRAARG